MTYFEPELIEIIEGPTPEFHHSPQRWLQSIYEGPNDQEVIMCQLRTLNGAGILERCQNAWREGRTVKLEYPDQMRMRQQMNVVAMRLEELEEGPLLLLWLSTAIEEEEEEEEFDESDDGFFYS